MKRYIQMLTIIFIGISLYALYGFLTFSPDENTPFVFNEPTLPPEILAEQAAEGAEISDVDEAIQRRAIEETQKAFAIYGRFESAAGDETKDILSSLFGRMQNWEMPAFLLTPADAQGLRKFETLRLDVTNIFKPSPANKDRFCDAALDSGVIIGTANNDTMGCKKDRAATPESKDIVFIGGPGADTIVDAAGNRIVNGGTGDDIITLGAGRSIIMLDAAWGHDTVTVDCAGSKVEPAQIPQGFPVPWAAPYSNFIVLGTSVDSKNLVWKDNVLTDTTTGDTLTVNEPCFTIAPVIGL